MCLQRVAKRVQWTLPYLFVLLAFALRIYRITVQSIWGDEASSIYKARLSMPEAIRHIKWKGHLALYFLLLRRWGYLAGFSELSVRFLSLLFGVLVVPIVYIATRRIFDRRTALVAMAITTIAPLQVQYSQEARMYGLVALEYLIILYLVHLLLRARDGLSRNQWLTLTVLEIGILYTHYYSVFVILYVNLLAVGLLALERRGGELRQWLYVQMVSFLLYLPWLWFARPALVTFSVKSAEARSLLSFASVTWHFYGGGTPGLSGELGHLAISSLVFAGSFLVLLPLYFRLERFRGQASMLLLDVIAPLGVVFVFSRFRPGFHPRYVLMLSLPLFILMARAISTLSTARGPIKLSAILVALPLLFTFGAALHTYYFDPRYYRDDLRSLARYLEEDADSHDIILLDYEVFYFDYYYRGAASVECVQGGEDAPRVLSQLRGMMQGKRQAFAVKWLRGGMDTRGIIPFTLELSGRLVESRRFLGFKVRKYELERPLSIPQLHSAFADFGLLQLTGAFFEEEVPADSAIALALRWKLAEEVAKGYKAAVTLWDEGEHLVAGTDQFLLNEEGLYTNRWPAGKEVTNFYILPIPPGTPPLSYTLSVAIYDEGSMRSLDLLSDAKAPIGKRFTLGSVKLSRPSRFSLVSPYGLSRHLPWTSAGVMVARGLVLEDFSLERGSVRPGELLSLALRWRATEDDLAEYMPGLRLTQGERVIAFEQGAPGNGRYPTGLWSKGEVVIDWRDLVVSPGAQEASAALEVTVDGSTWVPLAELKVIGLERLFEVPSMGYLFRARFGDFAELLGYELDCSEATTDQEVGLTLYWRAQNARPLGTSYKVFAHLLDQEGRLIGQHDGVPALGERPTTSWVEGEIIIDHHPMRFKEEDFTGQAAIEIGLYDRVTGRRVPLRDGADHLILPSQVRVKSE